MRARLLLALLLLVVSVPAPALSSAPSSSPNDVNDTADRMYRLFGHGANLKMRVPFKNKVFLRGFYDVFLRGLRDHITDYIELNIWGNDGPTAGWSLKEERDLVPELRKTNTRVRRAIRAIRKQGRKLSNAHLLKVASEKMTGLAGRKMRATNEGVRFTMSASELADAASREMIVTKIRAMVDAAVAKTKKTLA